MRHTPVGSSATAGAWLGCGWGGLQARRRAAGGGPLTCLHPCQVRELGVDGDAQDLRGDGRWILSQTEEPSTSTCTQLPQLTPSHPAQCSVAPPPPSAAHLGVDGSKVGMAVGESRDLGGAHKPVGKR